MKHSRLYSFFGERVLHAALWRINRESLADGFALGLFVALTPTVPFQMLIATALALYSKRCNLPLALVACWVTNPLTIVPIYRAEERLGAWMVENLVILDDILAFSLGTDPGPWMQRAVHLGIGSLFCASLAAVAASVTVRIFWDITQHRRPAAKN